MSFFKYGLVFLFFFITSCSTTDSDDIETDHDEPMIENAEVENSTTERKSPSTETSTETTSVDDIGMRTEKAIEAGATIAIYESATVYAGSTDYAFKPASGDLIMIRVSNFEEEKIPNPSIPDNMLESGDDLEGPPGANPEKVGGRYAIYYDDDGNVTSVKDL